MIMCEMRESVTGLAVLGSPATPPRSPSLAPAFDSPIIVAMMLRSNSPRPFSRIIVRDAGIEPAFNAWEALVLPLN